MGPCVITEVGGSSRVKIRGMMITKEPSIVPNAVGTLGSGYTLCNHIVLKFEMDYKSQDLSSEDNGSGNQREESIDPNDRETLSDGSKYTEYFDEGNGHISYTKCDVKGDELLEILVLVRMDRRYGGTTPY